MRTGRVIPPRRAAVSAGLLVVLVGTLGCGDGTAAPAPSTDRAKPPEAIAERAPAPLPPPVAGRRDLGAGHPYADDTIARFARLLEDAAWSLGDPPRNERGMLTALHRASGLRFVLVPGGTFRMGSDDGPEDERPARDVRVPAFLIAATECTQDAWDRVGGQDERRFRDPALPVDSVSWEDCTAWCESAGLRLPTEAEWERACRAGTTTDWSCGDDPAQLRRVAAFVESSEGNTNGAGARGANPWGLHDVHGNVLEWCADLYQPSFEGAPDDGSAWLAPTESGHRVLRGGAWNDPPARCRSAARAKARPGFRYALLGFRPAASLPSRP